MRKDSDRPALKLALRVPDKWRSALASSGAVLVSYLTALLGVWVADAQRIGGWRLVLTLGMGYVVVATAAVLVQQYFRRILYEEVDSRKRLLVLCREQTDGCISRAMHDVRASHNGVTVFYDPRESIAALVEALHNAIQSSFLNPERPWEGIAFEVTFMTRSHLDGYITVMASANKDGRSPRSMLRRDADPTLYEKTVTSELYRAARPAMRIVEDTSDPDENYQQLYEGQTKVLRSSIVYPVLSHANELIGTLVIHCDRSCFFKGRDERFWREVLEIYAKRIGLEKVRFDRAWTRLDPKTRSDEEGQENRNPARHVSG